MKTANVGSYSTALSIGKQITDEFTDEENESTVVYAISRDEWENLKQ